MADYKQVELLQNISDDLDSILSTGDITTIDITAIGTVTDDPETDPAAASATVASILRGILAELQTQTGLLNDIKTNTAPT